MQFDLALWLLAGLAAALYSMAVAAELALPLATHDEIRAQSTRQSERGEEGVTALPAVRQLVADPDRFLQSMLVLKTLALVLLSVTVARLLPGALGIWQLLLTAFIVGVVILLGQAWVRKGIGTNPRAAIARLAPPALFCTRLFWPLTWLVRLAGRRADADTDRELPEDLLLSESGLRLLMGMGREESTILESEKEMIASILDMDETAAREVMVPRMDMVALNVETTLQAALDVILEVGHSRIPVYEDNIDHIVGMLYAKDLLQCYRESNLFEQRQQNSSDMSLRALLRPAHFVPVSKKVNVLLRDMQKHRVHIAMVVDEYGGTAGLVTIEDILEEIVGDIQDEYDTGEENYVQLIGPATYLLNPRLDLYSLAKLIDTELPDEDADTLGGLIYSVLGHVPEQGEAVEISEWRFTVLDVDGNRIDQVRAERKRPPAVVEAGASEAANEDETESTHPSHELPSNGKLPFSKARSSG